MHRLVTLVNLPSEQHPLPDEPMRRRLLTGSQSPERGFFLNERA
jgi:hypothetical protein